MATPTPSPHPAPTACAASALSTHRDTRTAALEVAARLLAGFERQDGVRDGGCDLLLLFGSFHHRAAFAEAAQTLERSLEPRCVVGVTAEWVVGQGHEVEGGPGLSALAMRLPGVAIDPVRFDAFEGPTEHWTDEHFREKLAVGPDARATLLFADPFSIQGPLFLDRVTKAIAPHTVPIVGGLASGSSQPGANVLVLDHQVAASGVVGVTLSGAIEVDTLVSPGSRPLGEPFIVTKGSGTLIEALGGRPALDVARELVSELNEDEQASVREGLLMGFAIDEYRDRFGRDDFLLRTILGADPRKKAIHVGEKIKVGRTVRFHLRDRKAAMEDLELLLDREQMRERPFAAFMATCSSRGRNLFKAPHVDARAIARRLGDPPLAGFFAAGEIGRVGRRSWLHGHAISAAFFRAPVQNEGDRGVVGADEA
jgi:small ligand-binding sensory domain FIST